MKLSVVMATSGNISTIDSAVDSVLNQSLKDFEFIIIEDASTDGTRQKLETMAKKDKRIRLIFNREKLGLTKSLNLGINASRAKILARMDADDFALPERLRKQWDYLSAHPKTALLGTAVYLIDEQGRRLRQKIMPQTNEEIKKSILKFCPFIHPTWMLRREVIELVGGYNENFPFAQDYELALRIVSKFKAANLSEPLLNYRVNSWRAISVKNLKAQEWLALKARFLALSQYGYSLTEMGKLVKPILSNLIPSPFKLAIYRKFFW